ncbi:membrane protein insertase YidC [Candidatus Vallotia tarda]|uniref:Membrane protein insertase YidC n=1 Tax=Candidatus Vallotiella hemipterorum TaxID=1177213 RepID=A0A916JRR6_9BURK|nr:membrane protein insertase YidC [Candidatus Vallotia tarda]CAG7594925.1 Membrane protein insertase YidC [Candidatus Vallotia tarda]
MDIKRTVLWAILFMSSVMLYDNFRKDHGRPSIFFLNTPPTQTAPLVALNPTIIGSKPVDLPQTDRVISDRSNPNAAQPSFQQRRIHFKTDVYDGDISTVGGTLSRLSLIKGSGRQPDLYITLFDQTANHTYLARTGLIGGDFPNHNDIFDVVPGVTSLLDGANTMSVSFKSPSKGGVKVIKTYTFTRGSYVIKVDTKIENVSNIPVQPTIYMELVRDNTLVETPRFSNTFIGPAVYTRQHKFQKMSFSDLSQGKQNYASSAYNGWVAMVQHYFASAWIPREGTLHQFYADNFSRNLYRVGIKEPVKSIAPNESIHVVARLFAGPQEERKLQQIAPGLELLKDYGWVTIIAKPLFYLLEKIHSFISNWGWSIVLLTLLIKAIFFPLSAASYKSMARMKEITPRMRQLRERFKSDPHKMNEALMRLYKSEKVNPFGGCLPVVIQIPVFISLYWVLLSSVEMRGAPWVLWIHDLSQKDPYCILPVLMALSMLVQTKLNPTPPDPVQAKIMMFMPIAFSVMFFFFPAGLVLYYVVNNVLSIAQQYYITRMIGGVKKA